jgi:hypothetical protein
MMGAPALGITLSDLHRDGPVGRRAGRHGCHPRRSDKLSFYRDGSPLGVREGLIKYPSEAPTAYGERSVCLTTGRRSRSCYLMGAGDVLSCTYDVELSRAAKLEPANRAKICRTLTNLPAVQTPRRADRPSEGCHLRNFNGTVARRWSSQ